MFLFNQEEGDNIFFRERNFKDITKLYNIIDVVDSEIITTKGKVNIYEVKPCTVIGESEELKQNIYNNYLILLRMIPFNYKIVIKTGKTDFNDILKVLNKNMYSANNIAQKKMIQNYKEYLSNLSKSVQIFTKTFYIITNKLAIHEESQLVEAFNTLKHLGIGLEKITDENKIYNILYESMNKVSKGVEENEYY